MLSCISVNCSGNSSDNEISESEIASAKNDITDLIDNTWDALAAQDLERFKQYIVADWYLYTAHGNKMSAKRLFEIHRQNMERFHLKPANLEIHVQDEVAWATYDAEMSGLRQGESWSGDFIFTNVFVRTDEGWKVAHMHESMVQ